MYKQDITIFFDSLFRNGLDRFWYLASSLALEYRMRHHTIYTFCSLKLVSSVRDTLCAQNELSRDTGTNTLDCLVRNRFDTCPCPYETSLYVLNIVFVWNVETLLHLSENQYMRVDRKYKIKKCCFSPIYICLQRRSLHV